MRATTLEKILKRCRKHNVTFRQQKKTANRYRYLLISKEGIAGIDHISDIHIYFDQLDEQGQTNLKYSDQ